MFGKSFEYRVNISGHKERAWRHIRPLAAADRMCSAGPVHPEVGPRTPAANVPREEADPWGSHSQSLDSLMDPWAKLDNFEETRQQPPAQLEASGGFLDHP